MEMPDQDLGVELGVIEGFYGRAWSWADRAAVVDAVAPHGYRFYMYAPKADPYLRRKWQEPHPEDLLEGLRGFADHCRHRRVRFGVGLTPYDLQQNFDRGGKEALDRKLKEIDELRIEDLGVLFDDMRGDLPDLAERQAEIVEWVAGRASAERVVVCPSYYSDDPVLDRAFGRRPPGYLRRLGELLDPSIEIFWTGEEVCSREYSVGHLDDVAEELGRKPFLWDNYPVNDGQRMSQYLYLRAFTGRPGRIAGHLSAHSVNPALQPTLTRIPMLTLPMSYREGDDYEYGDAFFRAATEVVGEELALLLRQDLLILQDLGLDRLGEKETLLRERYAGIEHPAAREVMDWLDGGYRITEAIVHTQ